MTLRVAVVLGTRPEAIKLAPVIRCLQADERFQVRVWFTGQHREMVQQVADRFGFAADRDLAIMTAHQTLTDIAARALTGLAPLYQTEALDWVLVQGDTSTAFVAALGAFYHRIPVAHVEAGLRTDDLWNPYPEEANRRLLSQIASLHFAPTAAAVANLQRSGVTGTVHQTGNTAIDALLYAAAQHPACVVPGLDWEQHRVILATLHRRENWGEPLTRIAHAWRTLLDRFPDTALLLPLHPNPVVRQPLQHYLGDHPRAHLVEPLDYFALVGALQRCYLITTDSGGLQEEAPALGKPVCVLRETTERPEAIACGAAQLVGTETNPIVE
ncbi:MAG: UDP-N-acetylglucosamine 2-epimerase (non-hydrolyzing), partial [Pseudanabaenaceae cyanobacterium]